MAEQISVTYVVISIPDDNIHSGTHSGTQQKINASLCEVNNHYSFVPFVQLYKKCNCTKSTIVHVRGAL